MKNTRTLINELSSAKELCYKLASQAYDQGKPEDQKKFYAIADLTKTALDAALEQESEEERASFVRTGLTEAELNDFSEV